MVAQVQVEQEVSHDRSLSPLTITSSVDEGIIMSMEELVQVGEEGRSEHSSSSTASNTISSSNSTGGMPPLLPVVSPPASPTTTKAQVKPARKKRAYRKSKPSTNHAKRQLAADFVPSSFSVICGRGKECFDSEGNKRFRQIINKFLESYAAAPGKSEKSAIVSKAMNIIREASPQGAFVKCEKGFWFEVSTRYAREKVGAWFRDCLHNKYKSSSKAKHARKMAKRVSYNALDPEEIMNFPLDVEFDLPELDDKFYDEVDRRDGLDLDGTGSSSANGSDDSSGPSNTMRPFPDSTFPKDAPSSPSTNASANCSERGMEPRTNNCQLDPDNKQDKRTSNRSANTHAERHSGLASTITAMATSGRSGTRSSDRDPPAANENETTTDGMSMDPPGEIADAIEESRGTFYDIDDISLSLIPFDVDDDL